MKKRFTIISSRKFKSISNKVQFLNSFLIMLCVESHFSFIRWDSTTGLTERKVAKEFPESSVFSIGPSERESDVFMELCDSEEITNAWRFISPLSSTIASHIAESPELFRYQVSLYFGDSFLIPSLSITSFPNSISFNYFISKFHLIDSWSLLTR